MVYTNNVGIKKLLKYNVERELMSNEKLDVLNRDEFIQNLLDICNLLSDKKEGCCFAIDGAWGSGKSFVLEKFAKQLSVIQSEETANDKFLVFHYDCWKYDYYEEPLIAIVAAMLDTIKEEQRLLPENVGDAVKLSLNTAMAVLENMAKEYYKNKIGIDLVEVANNVLEEHDESKVEKFDTLYAFKCALEKTRDGMKEIAADKTMVIIVDELDRCLPEYAIKVLERLHHIFVDINNIIVIISMDKSQLEHSVKEIYGEINVDNYLRKFISFKVSLNKGTLKGYAEKFPTYFSMFDYTEGEHAEIEKFFSDILVDMDMRTIEHIFRKAEMIHNIVNTTNVRDCSIMNFEILFLTVSFRLGSKELKWLADRSAIYSNQKQMLGEKYYKMIMEYAKQGYSQHQTIDNSRVVLDSLMGKTFFWLVNIYYEYNENVGTCGNYRYSKQAKERVDLIHRFVKLIDIIETD